VFFQDEDVTDLRADDRVKRGLVLCRERHPVFRESSVVENLKIAGYLRKRSEIKPAINSVYEMFPKLAEIRKRRAGLMSGGEQQMLAVGIAMMANPRLLLLDEPLLGLSPLIQLALVESIERINKDAGVTIVVSEQFARPLIPIIDRGYILENGMLAFEGDSRLLFDNPDVRSAYFGVDYEDE